MCLNGKWLVSIALLISLVQSAMWMCLSVVSALVYLCVIAVPPYETAEDYLPVTLVKLYFEGPECRPNGSYLGQFNEDYRNPDVLRLFTPDKVFAVMVAYFIINAGCFILSIKCWLKRKPKSLAAARCQNELLLAWSVMTLLICAVDVVFCSKMISDIITLNDYFMGDKRENSDIYSSSAMGNKAEIPYLPLLLALLSSRFIGVWLWNFVVGLIFFFNAVCRRSFLKSHSMIDKGQDARGLHATGDVQPPAPKNLPNGTYVSAYDIRSHPDFASLKKSSEAHTRFSTGTPKTIYPKDNWSHPPAESSWQSSKPNTSKDGWEMSNEGYVSDDQAEPDTSTDFDHDLKNFQQGQGKIKIVRPPLGKAVEEKRE